MWIKTNVVGYHEMQQKGRDKWLQSERSVPFSSFQVLGTYGLRVFGLNASEAHIQLFQPPDILSVGH